MDSVASRVCRLALPALIGAVSAGFLGGCSSGPPEMTESQKQDQILQNPMGYKPNVGSDSSGGDTGSFDSNGFNKDVHDFFNP
jgi:hypothetical protein